MSATTKKQIISTKKGGEGDAKAAPPIVHPTLDNHHSNMLDSKKEQVDELKYICVKFFPKKAQEVTYFVDLSDGADDPVELTTAEFQVFLRKKDKAGKEEHEKSAAKGFYTKMQKRCLVDIGDSSVEKVRAVQASNPPRQASTLLNKTQEELKAAKLNEPTGILNFWNKMPPEVKAAMDDWQLKVNPSITESWSERLAQYSFAAQQQAASSALKKKAKETGLSRPPGVFHQESELDNLLSASGDGTTVGMKKNPSIVKTGKVEEHEVIPTPPKDPPEIGT